MGIPRNKQLSSLLQIAGVRNSETAEFTSRSYQSRACTLLLQAHTALVNSAFVTNTESSTSQVLEREVKGKGWDVLARAALRNQECRDHGGLVLGNQQVSCLIPIAPMILNAYVLE